MNGLPYYKRYPRDFFEGTIGMPLELKGPYSLIVDLIYMQNGSLPDDARYISGLLGCGVRQWNSIREKLIATGKIETRGGYLGNFRADKELVSSHLFQDKQRENGSKCGKNNGLRQALAKPKPSQSEPEPEEVKREPIGSPKKRRAPEIPLPVGWLPNERNIADALSRNFSTQEAEDEADRFRNHHAAKGSQFRDWDAAWRTWLGNARKFARSGVAFAANPGGNGRGHSLAAIVAERRLADQGH